MTRPVLAAMVLCAVAFAEPPAFRTIHLFSTASDGKSPRAALVLAPDGTAYGVTLYGGTSNQGTVYQLAPVSGTEKWDETVIYSFAGGSDGANPAGALVLGAGGVLYGTTVAGGSANAGTVFQLTPPTIPGGDWMEAVLYSFLGAPDGAAPHAGLAMSTSGVLYGTTAGGGNSGGTCASGCGTFFSLTSSGGVWTEAVLHAFNGSDGAGPFATLTAGTGGVFYGTTVNGGASGLGTVFSVATAGTVDVIYSFTGGADGANPYAPVIIDAKGDLIGAARNGGSSGMGSLFSVTKSGLITVLHGFAGAADGANPVAGLLLASGNTTIYGTASLGGASGDGTLFSLKLKSPSTTFKVLHSFDGVDQSANPVSTPVLALSGALLGTTEPSQVLADVSPDSAGGGSGYQYCVKNPPACPN